jgi:hypothetical protein
MESSILLQMSLEDFEMTIRKVVRDEVARQPEKLYTAKEAKEILGIKDHTTFLSLGLQPKIRGKRKLYSLKNA